jgi:hypothetical protein
MRRAWLFGAWVVVGCGRPSGPAGEGGETSTGTSESGQAGETEADGFVMDGPDLPDRCDPWLQDCADGEKCVPYASLGASYDRNKCVPILGDHVVGESCTYAGPSEATDDCDGSSVCWNASEVDGELVGTCQPFCTGTPDNPECLDGWYCQLYGDGSKTICELRCDPIAQDCADGLGCYYSGTEFLCVFTTSNIPAGEPCGFINDCAAGLVCAALEELPSCAGAACCTSFCELGLGDGQCDAVPGTVCVPFFEQAPVGQEHIGYCGVP